MMLKAFPEAPRPDDRSPESRRNAENDDGITASAATDSSVNCVAMALDALRDRRRLTQVQMAQLLKISQGAVSKVERRTDMFVSTLRNYVRAIGGDLEIRAVFPEGEVLIDQFSEQRPREERRPGHPARTASRRYERKTAAVL